MGAFFQRSRSQNDRHWYACSGSNRKYGSGYYKAVRSESREQVVVKECGAGVRKGGPSSRLRQVRERDSVFGGEATTTA